MCFPADLSFFFKFLKKSAGAPITGRKNLSVMCVSGGFFNFFKETNTPKTPIISKKICRKLPAEIFPENITYDRFTGGKKICRERRFSGGYFLLEKCVCLVELFLLNQNG